MKKFYFLAAIAAVVLGSCTSEEVLNQPSGLEDEASAIGFGTFLDRAPQNGVRPLASVTYQDELKNEGFTVLAYSTGTATWAAASATAPAIPDFMNDQAVEWLSSPGTWSYAPIKYWPKAGSDWGKVTFFGFSSTVTGATADGVANGNPQIYFKTAAAAESQVDLVADMEADKTKDNNPVKFEFDHILSRIGFQAKLYAEYAAATVTVTSLRVYYKEDQVNSSGTYTFNADDNKAAGNWDLTSAATFTEATPGNGDQIFTGTSEALTYTTNNGSSTLTAPNKYLMLIPQTLTTGDMYVELAYSITYSDNSTVKNLSKIDLPAVSGGWKPGTAYTYTFSLALNPVVFDTTIDVNGWGTESNTNVPIDN
jgi:hypothetical protein